MRLVRWSSIRLPPKASYSRRFATDDWRLTTGPSPGPLPRDEVISYGVPMTRESGRVLFGGSEQSSAGGSAQPRPAFGLRPWFALLRRARSLRRFAFAIVIRSVPGERAYRPGRWMIATESGWRSPPIMVAVSFVERLVGLRGRRDRGLLLRASSVHARGLSAPLRIVHLDDRGTVVRQDLLGPGRRIAAAGTWILELPIEHCAPDTGAMLLLVQCSRP